MEPEEDKDTSDPYNIRYWQEQINEARKGIDELGYNKPDHKLSEDELQEKKGVIKRIKRIWRNT